MSETQEANHTTAYSRINDANTIALRIKTEPQLLAIETFLKGTKIVASGQDQETGEINYKEFKTGEPKANQQGVQDIMLFLNSFFNQHVVMGNFKDMGMYWFYLGELHERLNDMLFLNKRRWGITTQDKPIIMATVLNIATAFLTRPLDNEERKGMNETVKQQSQVHTVQDRKGLAGLLGGSS